MPPTSAIEGSFKDHIREHDWSAVRQMVVSIPNLAQVKCAGERLPLHEACLSKGISKISIQVLLEAYPKGARVADKCGNLPLHLASASDAPMEVLNAILDAYPKGAEVANKNGRLPLHEACERKNSGDEIIDRLLVLFPTATLVRDKSGKFPQLKSRHFEIFREAAEKRAFVGDLNIEGQPGNISELEDLLLRTTATSIDAFEKLENKKKNAAEEQQKLMSENRELKEALEKAKDSHKMEVEDLMDENQRLMSEAIDMKDEISQVKQSLDVTRKEHSIKMNQLKAAAEKSKSDAVWRSVQSMKTLLEKQKQLSRKENQRTTDSKLGEDIEALKLELEESKAEVSVIRNEHFTQINQLNDALSEAMTESRTLISHKKLLEEDKRQLMKELSQKESELEDAQSRNQKLTSSNEDLASRIGEQVNKLNETERGYEIDFLEIHGQMMELKEAIKNNQLTLNNQQLEIEAEKSQSVLAEARESNAKLEEQKRRMQELALKDQRTILQLEAELNCSKGYNRDLTTRLESLASQVGKLQSELDAARNQSSGTNTTTEKEKGSLEGEPGQLHRSMREFKEEHQRIEIEKKEEESTAWNFLSGYLWGRKRRRIE